MLGKVLETLPKKLLHINKIDFLVIDDGSTDNTALIAREHKVITCRHIINRGLGAALATGFKYALIHNYDYVVTFDADGQHKATDVLKIVSPLINNTADVVIGSRLLYRKGMPIARRLINILSNIITLLLFKVWTTDSQSGFRSFNKNALKKIRIKSQRMEVSSEIFKEISRLRLKVSEVPIQSLYTNYSLRKGQKITNAPNVFWKLLQQQFS